MSKPTATDLPTQQRIHIRKKKLEEYRTVVGDELVSEIRELGDRLRGLKVLELSSTATGGGVAEMLGSLIPLVRDVGLDVEWRVMTAEPEFFDVTKRIHNGMQGMKIELSPSEKKTYLACNKRNAKVIEKDGWDAVIVHDPQPAAVKHFSKQLHDAHWIWRCHIDSSNPHRSVWDFLAPYVGEYNSAIFTMKRFVPPDLEVPTHLVAPAIDPFTSKNRELPNYLARQTVSDLGVDISRPILLQVSRFDPWKDPLGVVRVWRKLRKEFPTLQLVLVGSMASDDPEGWRIYEKVEKVARKEENCFVFTDLNGVSAHEVNAFQHVADVAIQKSIREGFGLIVSETLWKGTAIVAGRAGGIPLQLGDGVGGILAKTQGEFVEAVSKLLRSPALAKELGTAGRARVKEKFLLPRLLRDHLALVDELIN
jgi:trehalose synthase